MEHVRLGKSGLMTSRLIIGCMSFGDPQRGPHPWSIGIDEARPVVRAALDAGITCFDTANVYSDGSSEEILGALIEEFGVREQVVIATKVNGRMGPGPKGGGLSRGAILSQVEESLRRLGTDYIDLYQIHRLDRSVPLEETLQALDDLVRSGKVRYIGASSMHAREFVRAQYTADLHGWTRFVTMQDQYSLLMREEEREMHPFCLEEGVGVIPWSPLARGRLAREWGTSTYRLETDQPGATFYTQAEESDRAVVEAVGEVAAERGVSRAQVALAWNLHKPAVSAPIVGVSRVEQLQELVGALDVKLDDEEIARLETPYTPRRPVGF
ncbi:aldo/keto reductase [Actinacidiphila yeochonensis]|uniref:aldo/keto reductase n=1 Tax=Actinacidiphila yeochonensis TaxID=89050 RepID=UPI0005662B3C|nr:aldo/keto reductase [Actinacidiphila yeochonensis]